LTKTSQYAAIQQDIRTSIVRGNRSGALLGSNQLTRTRRTTAGATSSIIIPEIPNPLERRSAIVTDLLWTLRFPLRRKAHGERSRFESGASKLHGRLRYARETDHHRAL